MHDALYQCFHEVIRAYLLLLDSLDLKKIPFVASITLLGESDVTKGTHPQFLWHCAITSQC